MNRTGKRLSAREAEVLGLIARGFFNEEIAMMLHMSEETVKSHVWNIFAKLDVRTRDQAVAAWLASEDLSGADVLIEPAVAFVQSESNSASAHHGQ